MDTLFDLLVYAAGQVVTTFLHNWPFLLVSTLVAVVLKLFVDSAKVAQRLTRYKNAGVVGATAAAVATPLCSCGTTAVVLGMMASLMPWAPVVAFMVASPLTSPEELIYSAGIFGWPFAIAFFVSSILLGLLGGLVAAVFESRGWLKNQARFASPAAEACACGRPAAETCNCGQPEPDFCECAEGLPTPARKRVGMRQFALEFARTGGRLMFMFTSFAFVGYFLNGLIPPEWVKSLFGSGQVYSIPIAATLGLPLYVNTEASLPLVRALLDAGMGQGAALAFLITGAGTSFGAVAGALTIARWRVIGLVVGTLWAGAVVLGFGWDLLLAAGWV